MNHPNEIAESVAMSGQTGLGENGTQPSLVRLFLDRAMSADESQIDTWVPLLLRDATRERATDVHIDPYDDGARIRLRIDGQMLDAARIPREVAQQLINQMKVLAKLDPMSSPLPLESRWHETIDEQSVDVRLTVISCRGGEKLHARLLDRERVDFSLDGIGLPSLGRQIIEDWQRDPTGMLLVTGPTGTGKTTTLHAILKHFINAQLNVLTIEDPIEYELNGATQIQVDDSIGMSFCAGIRVMLRLDPDCMLVGELRDPESAETAMKAAATGHTVLSTMHARDAVGAVTTLRQWGVKGGPIATMLSVVVNQRLVGRLCSKCKIQREPNDFEREWFEANESPLPASVSDAVGCEWCGRSGIHGRTGVYEVWTLTDDDREQIVRGDDAIALTDALRERGHSFLTHELHSKLTDGDIRLSDAA